MTGRTVYSVGIHVAVTPETASVEVDGQLVSLSNLSRVQVPATPSQSMWTKCDTVNFYLAAASVVIEQTAARCTTMVRYPKGPNMPLYMKSAPKQVPEWVTVAPGPAGGQGSTEPYVVVDSLATLLWAVNYGAVEFHAPMACAATPNEPTHVIFDFDPGPGLGVVECCQAALGVRQQLGVAADDAVVKTSGSKGLHLLVPNVAGLSTPDALEWSRQVAVATAESMPTAVTAEQRKGARTGKVLIDWLQNQHHKTTAVAGSLRLSNGLGVSTVVSWAEVDACAQGCTPLQFSPAAMLRRMSGE